MIIKFCFILMELIFCLGCHKDKKNITKPLTDANRDLETYATAVSNFEFEKQRAKKTTPILHYKGLMIFYLLVKLIFLT